MNLYAFELGRKKKLCFAELISVLGKDSLVECGIDAAIFKLKLGDPQILQNQLGGTIKIIKSVDEVGSTHHLESPIQKILENHFKNHSGKIPFSISILNFKEPRQINLKKLLISSKKILKNMGLNSRFINKNFKNTRSSTIYKARVLEKGIDINIIKTKDSIIVGKTVAIQDIAAYSKRDYDKPGRDPKVGMLPPKLAQIMINLAGGPAKTIFDPFCGTGTVLMEGMLMGKTVIGSDIDERMIEFTEKNCEWLSQAPLLVFQKDARFLLPTDLPKKPDAIITEGYLGPPRIKLPSSQQREKIFREIENLYLNWLRAAHQLLPKKGKIVMCAPAYRTENGLERLPHLEQIIEESGYQLLQTFIYDRPDQVVAREVVVLKKI